MWIAILAGVGGGLLVAMFIIARQEKRYRVLFSDTHLSDLATALEAARTGAPVTTFEGITVAWERMPGYCAVTLDSSGALAAPAARFLLTFVCELTATEGQGLQLGKRRFAALMPREVMDRAIASPTDLAAVRARAADAMKGFAVVEGSLAAYR